MSSASVEVLVLETNTTATPSLYPQELSASSYDLPNLQATGSGTTNSQRPVSGISNTIRFFPSNSGADSDSSSNVMLQLQKVLSSLKLASLHSSLGLYKQARVKSGELCPICLSDIASEDGNVYNISGCSHKFHEECISRWKKEQARCPLCRGHLSDEGGEIAVEQQVHSLGGTWDIFLNLLHENQNPLIVREKISNILLAPFGLAWTLAVIALLLLFEVLCLCIFSPVVLVQVIFELCREHLSHRDCSKTLAVVAYTILVAVCLILPALAFLTVQLPFFTVNALDFCFQVFRCHKRWKDAFPYIANRTVLNFL